MGIKLAEAVRDNNIKAELQQGKFSDTGASIKAKHNKENKKIEKEISEIDAKPKKTIKKY